MKRLNNKSDVALWEQFVAEYSRQFRLNLGYEPTIYGKEIWSAKCLAMEISSHPNCRDLDALKLWSLILYSYFHAWHKCTEFSLYGIYMAAKQDILKKEETESEMV